VFVSEARCSLQHGRISAHGCPVGKKTDTENFVHRFFAPLVEKKLTPKFVHRFLPPLEAPKNQVGGIVQSLRPAGHPSVRRARPSATRTTSAAIQFLGLPVPEKPTMDDHVIVFQQRSGPGSYFSVGGVLLTRLNRPVAPRPDVCAVLNVVR